MSIEDGRPIVLQTLGAMELEKRQRAEERIRQAEERARARAKALEPKDPAAARSVKITLKNESPYELRGFECDLNAGSWKTEPESIKGHQTGHWTSVSSDNTDGTGGYVRFSIEDDASVPPLDGMVEFKLVWNNPVNGVNTAEAVWTAGPGECESAEYFEIPELTHEDIKGNDADIVWTLKYQGPDSER